MTVAEFKDLTGKLALVTGSSRGIGAAVSEHLARRGANVIVHYNSDSSAEKATQLSSRWKADYGVQIIQIKADLGTVDGPQHIVDDAKKQWEASNSGKQPFQIDIIVNNAGVAKAQLISDVTADDYAFQFNVNVRGPVLLLKAALPYLPKDRSGRIVNVSSTASGLGYAATSVYGATKAALEGLTRSWATEIPDRATVNAVNPGPVETDMFNGTSEIVRNILRPYFQLTPLAQVKEGLDSPEVIAKAELAGGRAAQPSEIASLVGLLVSPGASFTTGSVLNANGGLFYSS